jgi:GGDEF domain-containing protein
LLQAVTARLSRGRREQDAVFRIGGDEFVILVAAMPPDLFGGFADRLIRLMGGEPCQLAGQRNVRSA